MKKILYLPILFLVMQCKAQDVKISQPYTFLKWINVKDSIRASIYFQNTNDTLATKAYARGFAGGSLTSGVGIKVVGSTINIDTANYRKVDSLYPVTDSTFILKINGAVYTYKMRGAVFSFNGRIGSIVPQDNDYRQFYPKLDSTYNDPAWIPTFNWAKLIGLPSTLGGYGILNGVQNNGGVAGWQAGPLGSRPSASLSSGTFYYGTDDSTLFYSNGSSWQNAGGGIPDSIFRFQFGLITTRSGDTVSVRVDTTSLKSVFGSTSGGIFQLYTKYGLLIRGTDTASVDTTLFLRFSDTVAKIATKNYVLTRGFLTTETDPVATAKNITETQGSGILITGTASQNLGSSPVWVFKADTTVVASLFALKDSSAALRAAIGTGGSGISQIYQKYGIIINGTDTIQVDTTKFLRFKDTASTLATQGFVTRKGYLTTETDPVASGDTIIAVQGSGMHITGLSKQILGSKPSWTFNVDSSIMATLLALKDTAINLRAIIPGAQSTLTLGSGITGGSYNGSSPITAKADTSLLATLLALKDTAQVIRGLVPTLLNHSAGSGLTGPTYNGSSAVTWNADTTILGTLLAIKDTAIAIRSAIPSALSTLTLGSGLTGGSYNGGAPVTTKADTSLLSTILGVKDTAIAIRSIIPPAYDSNASQGGGFHTQPYNDIRYVKRTDSFKIAIAKVGQGLNLLNGVDTILQVKGMKDSGAAQQLIYPDSTVVNYVPYDLAVAIRNEMKIILTNNHVYDGNSITVCATCPSPSTQGYTVLMNDTLGLTSTTNRAVSNSTWYDILNRQLLNDPSGGVSWSYSVMGGENTFGEDADPNKWNGAREALRASIANHFMDTAWAISNSAITKTGSWSNITSANLISKSLLKSLGNPMKSSTLGNTLSFTIYDNNLVIGTYGWKNGDGYGSVSISIDGTLMVNPRDGTTIWSGKDMASHFTSQIGTYDARLPIVWVFSGLGIGAHSVVITLLSSNEVDFDYIGKMMPPSRSAGMLVFHVTKRTPAGYYSYGDVGGGPKGIDSLNRNYDSVCNTFRVLGLPVATAHTNEFLANNLFYTDGLHFLPSGHVQIANAGLSAIKRMTGGTVVTDTATLLAAGLESSNDKYLLSHPIYIKNAPVGSTYDTAAYANLDTAFIKADSTGWGLGKRVSQNAIAHFVDTATYNLHTIGYSDGRYAPISQPWTLNGSTINPSNSAYNLGIGVGTAFVPLSLVGHAQFVDTNKTVGSVNKYELSITSVQNAVSNGATTAMTGILLGPNVSTGDTLTNYNGVTLLTGTQSGKLINAFGFYTTGGAIGNVTNWYPHYVADVTVAGQAKAYGTNMSAGSGGKWSGFFGGTAPFYQGGSMNLGQGDSVGHVSALLDMSSTSQGLLMPRMTTAQQNGIVSPVAGLEVFNTDSVSFEFYNGSAWTPLKGGSGGGAGGTYITNITYPDSLHEVFVFNTGRTDTIAYNIFTGGGAGLADPGSNGIVKRTALNTTAIAVAADFPTLNQSTTGNAATATAATTAASLSGASALPSGTTATSQAARDSSGNVATTKYVDAATAGGMFLPTVQSSAGQVTSITADSAVWIRSGKQVSFSGTFTGSSTLGTGGSCLVQIQLPIPSLLAGGHACFGTATTTDFEIVNTTNNGSAASNGRVNSVQISGTGWAQVHYFSQTNNPATFSYTVHYTIQ